MRKDMHILSEAGIFLAGVVVAGILAARRRDASRADASAPVPAGKRQDAWQRALGDLESRVATQESATAARFTQVERRLAEQSARLADLPSTQQIVDAMEQLLARTMTSLDDHLTSQTHSIEVLKTTVSQTDNLLGRVLESLDSLQSYTEPLELTEDTLLQHEGV
jgi:uncharacterized coiled-coil protein SlyX